MELNLQVDLPDELMTVSGDQDKLDLLFDALVDNAVKFNDRAIACQPALLI